MAVQTNPCDTVLIVEDDRDIREALKDVIELEGYHVYTAQDGRQGLDILRHVISSPCLVLLDLMMPVMNGWEFLEECKQDITLATIPVVVVTAAGDAAKKAQASGYIKKPVDIEMLLRTVRRFCGHPASG